MAAFGNLSLALAFSFCIYSIFALLWGARSGKKEVVESGMNSLYVVLFFVTCAVIALLDVLTRSDFSIE